MEHVFTLVVLHQFDEHLQQNVVVDRLAPELAAPVLQRVVRYVVLVVAKEPLA